MTTASRFREAYASHRAAEGRGAGSDVELLALPYHKAGPWARHWSVRARTYERLVALVNEQARGAGRRLTVLDLGAGNGWLCYRLVRLGHDAVALDWRSDSVDGLKAAEGYRKHLPEIFPRLAGSFEQIPVASRRFDLVVFNAALHYAVDLERTLREAARVTASGGRIAILDSPFYHRESDGQEMVEEKRRTMRRDLGERANDLLSLASIEFLTRERLERASGFGPLRWRRRRVRYPLWYETRSLTARLKGRRTPSRFDLWEAVNP
jgi:SAM-dependent methyltransferase